MRSRWWQPGRCLLAGLMLCSLSGCNSTLQDQLGLRKDAPDEFQVVRRAPLVIPGALNELPPPQPGAPSLGRTNPSEDARRVLLDSAATANTSASVTPAVPALEAQSPGQLALLSDAGATAADTNIRQRIAADQQDTQSITTKTFLYIAFWQKPKPEDQPGVVLDPVAEAKRLQEQGIAASTRPLTVRVGSVPLTVPPVR